MIFGMTAFTFFHVLLSFAGILSGLVVLYGLLTANRMDGWTLVFLATTLATTLSGFLLPFDSFTPAVGVGIVSTIVLVVTIAARYRFHLGGFWRWIYVAGAVLALYLNCFVLVAQAFLKVPPAQRAGTHRLGTALRDRARHRTGAFPCGRLPHGETVSAYPTPLLLTAFGRNSLYKSARV